MKNNKTNKKKNILLTIIVLVVVVIVACISVFAQTRKRLSDNTATSTDAVVNVVTNETKKTESDDNNTTTELVKDSSNGKTDSEKDDQTASTTENKKEDTVASNAKQDSKKEDANASNTQNQNSTTQQQNTTQATQNTTQESSQKPSNNQKPSNSTSQGSPSQTTQQNTEHQHVWVDHKKTVHHDAEYEDRVVTKYKDEVYSVLICNQCGADITSIGSTAHYAASGTMMINCGTDENPWWVEVEKCSSCHSEWRHKDVPYNDTERVKVKDAYDEEVTDYQYCSGCGQKR